MVLWHGSVVLHTLLRLKKLVWRLDLRRGFCDRFKNRARHLLWTSQRWPRSPLLPWLPATARMRTVHGSCQLCLAVASRGTLVVLRVVHRHRMVLLPLTHRGCTRVGRPTAATVTSASRRAMVPCLAPSAVTQARVSSPCGLAVRTSA